MDWKIKLKTNKTLQNSQEKEMRNQKNKDKIEKQIHDNWDWIIKLKTNKTFIYRSRRNLKIKKITTKVKISTTKRTNL